MPKIKNIETLKLRNVKRFSVPNNDAISHVCLNEKRLPKTDNPL